MFNSLASDLERRSIHTIAIFCDSMNYVKLNFHKIKFPSLHILFCQSNFTFYWLFFNLQRRQLSNCYLFGKSRKIIENLFALNSFFYELSCCCANTESSEFLSSSYRQCCRRRRLNSVRTRMLSCISFHNYQQQSTQKTDELLIAQSVFQEFSAGTRVT